MYDEKKVKRAIRGFKNVAVYGPRCAVIRDDADTVSPGGIIIPDEAQKVMARGTIIKLGQSYRKVVEDLGVAGLEPGTRVTMNSYDGIGHSVEVNGEKIDFLILHLGQLYAGFKE